VRNLKVDRTDRKRLLVVSAATLVALPLIIKENQRHAADRPASVAVLSPRGLSASLQGSDSDDQPTVRTSPTAPRSTRPTVATVPATTTTTVGVLAPVPVPTTTIPVAASAAAAEGSSVEGYASYVNFAPGQFGVAVPCLVDPKVRGSHVTVTDTDNGHAVECTVVRRGALPNGVLLQLGENDFLTLEDLVQAPIPITASW
jgi:hypothetical protein